MNNRRSRRTGGYVLPQAEQNVLLALLASKGWYLWYPLPVCFLAVSGFWLRQQSAECQMATELHWRLEARITWHHLSPNHLRSDSGGPRTKTGSALRALRYVHCHYVLRATCYVLRVADLGLALGAWWAGGLVGAERCCSVLCGIAVT
jgi:hypothetical protein